MEDATDFPSLDGLEWRACLSQVGVDDLKALFSLSLSLSLLAKASPLHRAICLPTHEHP